MKQAMKGRAKDKRERCPLHAVEYEKGYKAGLEITHHGYAEQMFEAICSL